MGGLAVQKLPFLLVFLLLHHLQLSACLGLETFGESLVYSFSLERIQSIICFLGWLHWELLYLLFLDLRAVARIFYGSTSDELLEHVKKNPISDLKMHEIVPAGIILLALLFLGFWPRGISDRIDTEIETRYSKMNIYLTKFLPPVLFIETEQF